MDRENYRVKTSAELRDIPNYQPNVDFSNKEIRDLKEIIFNYKFNVKDKVQCGITACKQWHANGYIIATTDGIITNIGNVCGAHYLSEKFNSAKIDLDIREKRRRESKSIIEFIQNKETTKSQIMALRESATKFNKFCESLDSRVYENLSNMAKSRNPRIVSDEPLKTSDARVLYSQSPKNISFEEWVKRDQPKVSDLGLYIYGVSAITTHFGSLIKNGAENVMVRLDAVASDNLDEMSDKNISKIYKDINFLSENMRNAEKGIEKAEQLMDTDPILFRYLPNVY